jgi:hypothetical protein
MKVVEADLGWDIPPSYSSVIRVGSKNTIIDDSDTIDGHHMSNEHKQLPESLIVDFVQPYSVIGAR